MTSKLSPIHPGQVLLDEFIKPMNLNLSQNRLAPSAFLCKLASILDGAANAVRS